MLFSLLSREIFTISVLPMNHDMCTNMRWQVNQQLRQIARETYFLKNIDFIEHPWKKKIKILYFCAAFLNSWMFQDLKTAEYRSFVFKSRTRFLKTTSSVLQSEAYNGEEWINFISFAPINCLLFSAVLQLLLSNHMFLQKKKWTLFHIRLKRYWATK